MNINQEVEKYLENSNLFMQNEIEIIRKIILEANPKIQERIKWSAPSFYYKKDMAAFHNRAKNCVHLTFVFYDNKMIHNSNGLLEGEFKDRRFAKFYDIEDIENKKNDLINVVNQWVELIEEE
jgi:hypothetical protein